MKRWYVVHTQARSEDRALANLLRQGFEAWLPRLSRKRSHARRIDVVTTPFFPRYLFVAFDPMDCQWRSINGTRGVSCLLTSNDRPLPVPDALIVELRSRANAEGLIELATDVPARGAALRVIEGPFAELVGRFEKLVDGDRVLLLLELLGRTVRTTLSLDQIEPAA